MINNVMLCNLYDIYGELLTDKQKNYFHDYYFLDLSLGELSENYGVSRNAIYKTIKEVEDKLNDYEFKLKLLSKKNAIKKIINNLDNDLKEQILKLI